MIQRLVYIDVLRALAIMMVAMEHLAMTYKQLSLFFNISSAIGVPLFMTISGFLTNYDRFRIEDKIRLLIPVFLIGLPFTTIWQGYSFSSFFMTMDKNGYWFLWALFFIYVLLYLCKLMKLEYQIAVIGIYLFLITLLFLIPTSLNYLLSLNVIFLGWIPFSIVFFMRCMPNFLFNRNIWTYIIILMILLLLTLFLPFKFSGILYGTCISCILFPIMNFYFNKVGCYQNTLIKWLLPLGKHTLQIYTLHYLFLYYISLNKITRLFVCGGDLLFVIC